nr:hypothetical protein [Tanacetum cinerariifolium]
MQTQTSNTLHNAIMEAGSKDRPTMLAPGNYVQWKSRIKRYIDTKPNHELIHHCLKNLPYKFTCVDIEVSIYEVQIILTRIDNDIYSTVDAYSNACEMWKAIERLKQGWKEKAVLDSKGNLTTATERIFETYKNVKQEIRDQLNTEAKAVQIILTGIDNDIYSTVDACPNACEMWKAIERLKQGESINVQDLETICFGNLENSRHWMVNHLNRII